MLHKIFFLSLFLIPSITFSQCTDELKNYITGFNELKSSSFDFLDDKLDTVKIVGYGEDTHGSAEFTLVAKELMSYLTTKHDFNILILETGFGEGQYLNEYIQGKRNDIKTILKEHNSTWRYRTLEFLTLMKWLREYNEQSETKITIYGCEMQYVISDIHRIENYLKKVGSNYKITGFEKYLWQNITEKEKYDYYISLHKLKSYFNKNYEEFKNKTSEKELNLIYHHIEVVAQFVTTIHQSVYQRKMDFRDIYMAENVTWILANEHPESKALFWAHNDHIGNWIANGMVDVAGHFLKKTFGDSYYNIATDFGTGDFFAFPHNPKEVGNDMRVFSFEKIDPDTFTHCIQQHGTPNAFVDLRSAKLDEILKYYLEKPLNIMYGAGSQEWGTQTRTIDIGKAFDAIIYIDKITTITFFK